MKLYRDGLEETIDGSVRASLTGEGHRVESYQVGGRNRFFVTLAGTTYCAHGDTLAEAVADAIWKDPKQRPSLESLKASIREDGKDRKITLHEFRVLTGACRVGCYAALRKAGIDGSPMRAADIQKYFPEWGTKLLRVLEWQI